MLSTHAPVVWLRPRIRCCCEVHTNTSARGHNLCLANNHASSACWIFYLLKINRADFFLVKILHALQKQRGREHCILLFVRDFLFESAKVFSLKQRMGRRKRVLMNFPANVKVNAEYEYESLAGNWTSLDVVTIFSHMLEYARQVELKYGNQHHTVYFLAAFTILRRSSSNSNTRI